MDKNIRIKDIAKLANVSVGTVDRVIHNRGEVAAESYQRVMAILETTGYKPNLLARTLGSNKTFNVAALVPNPQQDEYWDQSDQGLKQAELEWQQYGVQLKIFHFDLYDKTSFAERGEKLIASKPDAVLTAPIFYQEAKAFFKSCDALKIPFVMVNNNIEEEGSMAFIGQDLYQSGRLGAELLHWNNQTPGTYAILHVYDDIHNSVHLNEKEKGFRDYFSEHGDDKFKTISLDLNHTHEATLEKELNDVLARHELRGILVTTSRGAYIVSKLIEKKGKNGLRFVAYDMLKQNLHYLKLGIIDFLINQNSKRQAFMGVSQLANHLLFKKHAPSKYLFPLEIISRQNLTSYLKSGHH